MNTQTLDVIGLKCPLPILRAKKALAQMQEGEVLTVLATDGARPVILKRFAVRPDMSCWNRARPTACSSWC